MDCNRRDFINMTAGTVGFLMTTGRITAFAESAGQSVVKAPWYRTVTRWGQVNINEKDPQQYDIAWWRNYWRRTNTRGIIANAGGIVAYYPTKILLHRKAEYLGNGDLFGDLCRYPVALGEDSLNCNYPFRLVLTTID